ncbi:helix-turn-helix transcriptional regulator [Streptomyces kaniharaensis]|uniref:Helix-turn-helix transcriptional regulator n=1 Tax=Streptomyces kaniharaensis TaxID=212423 RepID=A0A6N7L4W3_9ACTN|nr:helix-turn-helix transcriptional regulator [Streptomyces kaniharaensis]MQS17959.1 helix-turn-helix transcriptional regulator [Streptomyces kaniharaensis]
MPALPESLTTGQRIQRLREARGMSRAVLAGLLGRSEGWLKAVEKGRLLPPRLPMLVKIAEHLRVADLSELTGSLSLPTELFAGPEHPALAVVRRAVDSASLAPAPGRAPDLDHVAAALASGWAARDSRGDHRTALAELLPGLVADVAAAAVHPDVADRRRALVLYASVLNLVQMYAAYQGDGNLVWRVAERSLATARAAGDPAATGQAAWFLVQALRESGQWDSAQTVTEETLLMLDPLRSSSPDLAAAWAAMGWHAAITHARAGESGSAWGWFDRAETVARTLPATWWSSPTSASPTAIAVHGVTVAVELRQVGTALAWADRLDPRQIPARPRRARHLVEVARAHQLRGEHQRTAELLGDAVAAAPETPRWNSETHALVRQLLDGPASVRPAARQLAGSVGIAA